MSQSATNPIIDGAIQNLTAFQTEVSIPLFNAVFAFIVKTSAADAAPVIKRLEQTHLWYSHSANDNIQEQYGFRYFGELLERFEDKAGSDVRDIRAIALALAYAKNLLTDDMVVGKQKINFIKKITLISEDDIYLKGALYLLSKDDENSELLLEELAQKKYQRTEEVIFILSLYDNFKQAFEILKPQLLSLLGASRNIPLIGNVGIISWFVKRLDTILKEFRSKDMALFRALSELPVSFVKSGSRPYEILIANNYTPEEIIYANSVILLYKPVKNTLYINSITAEKIAVEMWKTYINSEHTHSGEVYAYLTWLFKTYEKFEIKIQGFTGIFGAVREDIKLANPQTFIWLYGMFANKSYGYYDSPYHNWTSIFRFDIADEKWDSLASELDSDKYLRLFNEQLIRNKEHTSEQVKSYIQKYDTLTKSSYLKLFEIDHDYNYKTVFGLLVEKGLIYLQDAFAICNSVEGTEEKTSKSDIPMMKYIGDYIRGIHSREAFDFFKYFFGKYDFDHMISLFIDKPDSYNRNSRYFEEAFYHGPPQYHGDNKKNRIEIERSFLSADEHRELFSWLDKYMCLYSPEKYIEFSVLMLLEPFIATLYPKDELRRVYDMVCGIEKNALPQNVQNLLTQNIHKLKEIFLTEEELQAEHEAETIRIEKQKQLDILKHSQDLRDEYEKINNGSFKSLSKFWGNHKYSIRDENEVMRIIKGGIDDLLKSKNYTLDPQETGRFIQLSGKLIEESILTLTEFTQHIIKIKEENNNVTDNNSSESDNDDE